MSLLVRSDLFNAVLDVLKCYRDPLGLPWADYMTAVTERMHSSVAQLESV